MSPALARRWRLYAKLPTRKPSNHSPAEDTAAERVGWTERDEELELLGYR